MRSPSCSSSRSACCSIRRSCCERPLELLGVLFVIVVGKSLAAFAIVLAFGYPVRTALTVSASLAQIGEFSFILAGLGVALGLLPPAGRDLILAGALLSITFNPFAFGMIAPMTRWLDRAPARRCACSNAATSAVHRQSRGALAADLRDHAVIVGYGRVGSVVGHALEAQGLQVRGDRTESAHRRGAARARCRRDPRRRVRERRAGPRGGSSTLACSSSHRRTVFRRGASSNWRASAIRGSPSSCARTARASWRISSARAWTAP